MFWYYYKTLKKHIGIKENLGIRLRFISNYFSTKSQP